MNLSGFTFIVTGDCNYHCSYCYQAKDKKYCDCSLMEKAVDFFSPYFNENCYVGFYGGEPLLAFEQTGRIIDYIQEKKLSKKIRYSLTTNGSLLNEEILNFLERYKFSLILSFDGLAQEISRKRGSFAQIYATLEKILERPGIDLEVNSVFTPDTVKYLSASLKLIVDLRVQNVALSLSNISPWHRKALLQLSKELDLLKKIIAPVYKKTGAVPVVNFRKNSRKGVARCSAGDSRMALSPDGKLWGCCLFPDYFKGKEKTADYHKYSFGDLDSFIANHEKIYREILPNYAELRMDNYCVSGELCLLCDDLEECWLCPIDAAFSGESIGEIPPWLCETNQVLREAKRSFWEEF